MREQQECTELYLGAGEDRVESLWARINGEANIEHAVVDVFHRPPLRRSLSEAFY